MILSGIRGESYEPAFSWNCHGRRLDDCFCRGHGSQGASQGSAPGYGCAAHNWNGCYIGGNVGGKWWANTSGTVTIQPDFLTLPTSFDFNSNGGAFIGGGQVGCNYQAGQIVFGIEGDGDWQHLNRTGTLGQVSGVVPANGSFSLTSDWQASIRGRLGYAADRVLWYATGGVAWTKVSFSGQGTLFTEDETTTTPFNIVSVSKTAVGGTAGVGVEFAVANQVTLGLEGRYTWYGSQHFDTSVIDAGPAGAGLNLNTAEVIGKVNWKFGGNYAGTEEQRERR